MEWFVKAFIRASLFWFGVGTALGLAMALRPSWVVYRPAHAHLNVVGFLTMLVFGVGYQLLPRLFGGAVYSRRAAGVHFYLANVGLAALVTGFVLVARASRLGRVLLVMGGSIYAAGVVLWVWNLWRSFGEGEARSRARRESFRRSLPTLER